MAFNRSEWVGLDEYRIWAGMVRNGMQWDEMGHDGWAGTGRHGSSGWDSLLWRCFLHKSQRIIYLKGTSQLPVLRKHHPCRDMRICYFSVVWQPLETAPLKNLPFPRVFFFFLFLSWFVPTFFITSFLLLL